MLQPFNHYVKNCMEQRTDEIATKVFLTHRVYRKYAKELKNLFNEIVDAVPQDRRFLMFEYEEKEQAQLAVVMEIMYRQGLEDGVEFSRSFIKQ